MIATTLFATLCDGFTSLQRFACGAARRARAICVAPSAALLLVLLGGAAGNALALPSPPDNTVYGNVGTNLLVITPSSGAAVSVGTLAFATAGIGRDPITGRVYYAENAVAGRIAYWDPTTATNTILPTALGFTTNRLGFRADGQMFSMNPGTNNIYVIDRNTGNPTIVATVQGVPLNGGGDMAFAPNGDLYIVTSSTTFRVLQNPIFVPPAGAVPAIATTSGASGTTGSPTGLTFIGNGVALGSPTTGIVDLGLNGGFTNARGANSYSDLGAMPKFADIAISVTPSSSNFPRTGSASYAVSVVNNGPQSASGNFTVTFTLPAGLTLVGGGPFGTGWSCTGGPTVTCTNTTSSLVVGAGLPTLNVPVTTNVAAGTNSVATTFTVADTTFDSFTANNTTTVSTGVGAATIAKTFLTNPMPRGGTSTLVLTLSNPTGAAFTGVSFTDTLPTTPGAMVVAAVPNISTVGCGTPTFAPAAGAASLAFSGGSIAAGGTCTVRVDITAPTSGNYANTTSGVTTTQTGAGAGAASNTATLLVMTPPTIAKAFSPSPVIPNGPSVLTITLTNPAANGANAITGATFTDVFPTTPGAMTLADTTVTNGCGGTLSDAGGAALAAGSTAVRLVGGTVPAGGSCIVRVNVKAPTAGTYNNTTNAVSSANAGTGVVSNTAPLVVSSIVAPNIAKDFSPAPIAVGGTSTLTFTITNPNPTTALTGVAFGDTFPTSPGVMRVAATPAVSTVGCGTPTFAPAANAVSLAFSAGTIAAGGTCTVRVNITVLAVGAYVNVSGAVSASGPSALTGNTATASIATLAPPVVAKAFSPATIGTGGISTVTISLSNPNGSQAITGVALTDALPTTPGVMRVAAVPNASVSGCGAPTFAPIANAASVAFSNGTIAGGGVCTITFNVTAPTAGSYTNSTGTVTSTDGGSGVADTDVLTVVATAPVSITKAFLTSPMAANVPATLRFTLVNPNTGTALAGVAFSDTFPTDPGAMRVAATPAATTSGCGAATFAPTAGSASVAFSAGSIAAGATCTVDVNVTAPVAGTYANTTSTVTSTTPATTGAAALANVDVLAAPIISKTFLTSPVAVNVPTTLRFDIANPNGLALANLSFTDVLPTTPGAMVVAPVPNASTSGCGSPSFTPSAGAASLTFSTASVAAGATCRVSVDVVAPVVGSYVNTSSAISSTNGGTGNTANATLSAVALNVPTLSKSFANAGPIAPGTPNALTLTLGNSNAGAITLSAALVDNLPSGMTVASPANSSGTCVGVTATPGDTKITLTSGSSIPPGGCTVVANVVASTGGTFTNTLAAGALATSAGSNAAPASASFSVPFAPAATKSFAPTTVAVGVASVLKITLLNSNASTAVSGAAFTDTYPSGLVNTATPAAAISGAGCSGTVTGAANGTSLSLSGGVIPASGSCDITVNVTSATAASYLNSSGAITTTNVGTGNASSATLTVSVGSPLVVAKSFTASAVAPGVASVLRIRLTNPNGVAITGATFTDAYPSGLVNTAAPAGTITGAGCTGSVTAAVNGTSLALSAGNIPANGFCDITANTTSSTPGSYANDSGTVATSNGGTAASSSATLVVLSPPTVAKTFAPSSVSVNGVSVLRITVTNANTGTALSGVAFTDSYPAGLVNTATPAGAITGTGCSGTVTAAANGTSLALSAGSVPAGGSCAITVNVTSATAATYNNTSGPVSTTNAGTGAASIGTLSVVSGPAPLTVVKTFTPASIGTNDTTQLKITLQNPNGTAVTGAAFTDTYPFALFNTAVPGAALSGAGCTGTVTAAANGSSLALSAGNVPASSSCDITVSVTSSAANTYVNNTGAVTTTNAGTSASVNGTLVVLGRITALKAFTPTSVEAGSASILKITLSNPNAAALTGVAFNDAYPSGLVNTATPAGAISGAGCSGTVTAANNGTALVLSGGTVPANGSCEITANVTSAAAGSYANTSGTISTANAGTGTAAGATLTVTAAMLPALTVAKTFTPASIGTNDTTQLKIRLTNPSASAVTGAAFTDSYPSGLVNTAAPGAVISGAGCSGTVTAAANGNSLVLSAGNVPANGSCDITVSVSSAAAGTYVNSSGPVSAANAATSASVNGTLVVLGHITAAKAFMPTSVSTNAASVLKITLSNPNAVALTGVAFNDAYPSGLVNTATPAGAISGVGCSGTVTAANNGTALVLSGGTVPANGSCEITANVTSAVAGSYANTSGAISTANAGAGAAAGATLTVTAIEPPPAPQASKVFMPSSIGVNGTTQLKITLVNVNTFALTSVAFTDTYPASMFNTAAPSAAISGTAGCTGTLTATAGGTTLALSGGNLPALGSCDFTVNVTATTPGFYVNSTGPVATAEAPNGTAANGMLTVLANPTLLKAFAPTSVTENTASVLTITVTNPNAVALTGVAFNDAYPSGLVNTATPAGAISGAGCSGSVTAAANGTSLALSGGTVPAGSSCDITVNVTSATAGSYSNTSGGASSTQTVMAGEPSNTAVLTVTAAPTGVSLSGFVYADANHNLQRDAGEAGTGLVLHAKLIAASSPGGPALQAVVVDSATGAYQFNNVAPGEYFIVIDDNASLADVTPAVPAAYTGTEAGDQVRRNVVVAAVDLTNLNFGLFNGNLATGRVFRDNGTGGGTPNNALQDGNESGIAAVPVRLTNAAGTTTHDSTTTDAAGNYRLWIPAALTGTTLHVTEDNPAGLRSVGGFPTASYDRNSDRIAFAYTAGVNAPGLNFADVAFETLVGSQQRGAAPGEAVFYAHTFTPGTGGSVAFSATASAAWPQTLLRDTNCNGVLDAGEGVIGAAITATAGTTVCVIVKVSVPSGAAVGAQNLSTLQAVMSYSNASPPLSVTLTNEDTTTVGGPGGPGLALVKSQDNATPLPGGRITYTIAYTNQGSGAITSIRINDTTPAFTLFVSATCLPPLAAGLSACSVTGSPAVGATGAIEWTLVGSLLPSATGQVSFVVDLATGP